MDRYSSILIKKGINYKAVKKYKNNRNIYEHVKNTSHIIH